MFSLLRSRTGSFAASGGTRASDRRLLRRWLGKKAASTSEKVKRTNGGSVEEPRAPIAPKRLTIAEIQKMKKKGIPITVLTAYDYPSAVHADLAQVDIVLVGDSVAMVVLGHDTTQMVTMDEMLHHCRAVMRGARRPLVVGDMPFGSYEVSPEETMHNAYRFIKEAGVNAVKMEGGSRIRKHVERVVKGGIAVMGHTGLTPASVSAIGQFRSFGKTAKEAIAITEDALALQDAGACAVVLECVPERVARFVTDKLEIPTIGIGAGRYTSGQVLVYHDVLGMLQHPHHAKVTPKFVKRYAQCAEQIQDGLRAYREEVRSRSFPSDQYCPYKIPDHEWSVLCSYFANTAHVMPPKDAMQLPKGKSKSEQDTVGSKATAIKKPTTKAPAPTKKTAIATRKTVRSDEDEESVDLY